MGLILFALSFGPRNERALFIVEGPDAQAFTALLPTPNPVYAASYGVGGGAIGSPGGRRGARGLPSNRGGAVGGTPETPAATAVPTQLASAPQDIPGLAFPGLETPSNTPVGGVPGGDIPGLPGGFEPGLPGSFEPPPPGTDGPPDPEVPPTDPDVVPPIPEPSTWLMLIAGFGVIGAAMRRRTRPSRSVEVETVGVDGDAAHAGKDILA